MNEVRALKMAVASLLVASIVMMTCGPATAEDGPIWRRAPGGRLAALTIGASGHIYVTGSLRGSSGDALMVAKYGVNGQLVWRRTWRHAGRLWHAAGTAITPAPGGGIYAGGFSGSGTGEGGDALLMRYTATGRRVWRREIPEEFGTAIVVGLAATSRGVVAAVEDHGCCDIAAEREGYVQAFRADGTRSWRSPFEARGIDAATRDTPWAVATGHGDRVYAAGSIDRKVYRQGSPPPDVDRMIQALGPDGRVVWTRVSGLTGHSYNDSATDVAVRGGLVVASGNSWPRSGNRMRAWLMALDTGGRRRWAEGWGGGRHQRFANAVAIAPWGPIYVGTESSLRRYSPAGTLVWKRPLPDGGWVSDVAAAGSVYLVSGRELQRWQR
ncbi:MAG: hypothetical protein OEW66_03120 [Actinomycetota bacterium]|nr:hypothetical protein [Actinomycetota bacterium]MDH5312819.1 hypothetical protein [Actinomycetota bacterium]